MENRNNSPKRKNNSLKAFLVLFFVSLFVIFMWQLLTPKAELIQLNSSASAVEQVEKKIGLVDENNQIVEDTKRPVFQKKEKSFSSNGLTEWVYQVKNPSTKKMYRFYVYTNDSEIASGKDYHTFYLNEARTKKTKVDSNSNLGVFLVQNSAPHHVQPSRSIGSIFLMLLNFLPTILFLIFITYLIVSYSRARRRNSEDGGSGGTSFFDPTMGMGKTPAKIAKSSVKFDDVAGIEEEKEELFEIVDYLKNPEKYKSMGARTPKGVILYGPPGTGKTLLAKAVAGEAGVPFMQVSGSAFEEMLVGVGAKRIREMFSKAKKMAPSIIFIDEIDAVGSKRGNGDFGNSGSEQTLNQLLSEMDGFETNQGVVVIAATNRLDTLDGALLRPGRFDRHVQINLPDIKEREKILKIHAKNKNVSSSANLQDIARRTPGFSGAQLENVLNEAAILAVRQKKNVISTDDLDEAIDRVMAGPAKKQRVITEEEKKQVAYHEAGHAIVGINLKGGEIVEKITIIPRGQAGGYTLMTPEKQDGYLKTKQELLNTIASLMGGRASEKIFYGEQGISMGASNDFYKATHYARSMVTSLGMSEKLGMRQYVPSEGQRNPYMKDYSEKYAESIDYEINKIISDQYEVAYKIIEENKEEVELIVETLMLLETIVRSQIEYIHENKKLPIEAINRKTELERIQKEKETENSLTSNQVESEVSYSKEDLEKNASSDSESEKLDSNNKNDNKDSEHTTDLDK